MLPVTQPEIRRAHPEDAAAIAHLLHASFVEFKALYTEGGFAATALDVERVLVRMAEGPVWLALRERIVLGTVAAAVKGNSAYIRGMAVAPSARGSGIGAALLDCVEQWAITQRCGRLFLSTTPFLDSAIRLYEGSGFTRADEGPLALLGTPLFTMEKYLARNGMKNNVPHPC